MFSLIRRLFRRIPPHLAGRVPVDAGEGTAASEYFVTAHSVCRLSQKDQWGHLTFNASYIGAGLEPWTAEAYERHREEKGRAFEQAPPLPSGARPDWAVREANAPTSDVGCDCTGCPHRWVPGCPPLDASEIVLRTWFAARVERPSPADVPTVDTGMPQWEAGDARWMMYLRKAAQEAAVRKMTEHLNRRVWTPPDASPMTLEDFGWPKPCAHGDGCCLPECAPKPSPAENAKRYTREDGTW